MTRLFLTLCFISTYSIFCFLEDYRERYTSTTPAMDLLMGSFPSGISVVLGALGVLICIKTEQFVSHFTAYSTGLVIYECLQISLPRHTFDIRDLIMIGFSYSLIIAIWFFATRSGSSTPSASRQGSFHHF